MKKLIKINDEHYVVVDDSEMLPDVLIYDFLQKEIKQHSGTFGHLKYINDNCKKIIHSTQPLEEIYGYEGKSIDVPLYTIKGFNTIKQLSLSEVEEAINGYSVEKMAYNYDLNAHENVYGQVQAFKAGFKAHENLVKDKLFTTSDLEKAMECVYNWMIPASGGLYVPKPRPETLEELKKRYIQSLIPTEWEVKEITPEGKIILL